MKTLTSDEIRDIWLNFFNQHQHHIEPSASLIPNNDPSLLWINAGVAALKKYFDGTLTPKYRRITNAQKCIRTNDIDNVGHTARHHTFFEMMGNFSIGDYFRNEVIPWAYELLTSDKYYGLDPTKLYVTYYPDDTQTHDLWVKCGIPEENMVPSESNFWEIGEGPCGPDTEINYDRGEKYDPEHKGIELLKNDEDNDRYIELWNIVFSQYDAKPGVKRSEYKQLPQKNIDTGAGLERIACIMQNAETNFETDLFMPYINKIKEKSKYPYDGEYKLAYRVIADHIRSITFALADGAVFSNDGRGYVLRRLLRRSLRYAQKLQLPENFLSSLVKTVTDTMSHYYPYLKEHEAKTMKMIESEEKKFSETLKKGEKVLASYLQKEGDVLSGSDAFKLSDTYGFPIELTREIANDSGKKVDEKEYENLLKQSKELARNARGDKQSFASQSKDLIEFTTQSEFTYEKKDIKSKVIGIFKDGVKVASLDDEGDVIFEKTPFYALSGGQVSDSGTIVNKDTEAQVNGVIVANHGQHLIHVKLLYGNIKVGDILTQKLDIQRREAIERNHSATHLLQKALQELLSCDVHQEGAFYDENCLHFDINYDSKISQSQLDEIENRVNDKIQQGLIVSCNIMSKEEALKKNAMHLFSEKYGDNVRVVSMGDYSIEFCGGCHVKNTKDISLFVIQSEESIAAGIRRITALTGKKAYEYLKEKQRLLLSCATDLKMSSDFGIKQKISAINLNTQMLNSQIKALREENSNYMLKEIESGIKKVNENKYLVASLENLTHEQEDSIAHKLIDKYNNLLLLLTCKNNNGKIDIVIGRGKQLNNLKAGQLMKEVSLILNGRGGGKDDVAFGATDSIDNIKKANTYLKGLL